MSGRVFWRAVAEEDLTEAYLYIGADSLEVAERLVDAVADAVALLLENPRAGSPREFRSLRAQGIRSWSSGSRTRAGGWVVKWERLSNSTV